MTKKSNPRSGKKANWSTSRPGKRSNASAGRAAGGRGGSRATPATGPIWRLGADAAWELRAGRAGQARRALLDGVAQTPSIVAAHRAEIASLAAPFHAFDVVCAAWMQFGLVRPHTLRPYAEDGFPFTAEYIAHVLLERPDASPVRPSTQEDRERGVDLDRLGDLVADVVHRLPLWFAERDNIASRGIDPFLDIRARLFMHRMASRSFTYSWQEEATLHELFDAFEHQLGYAAGFTLGDGLALQDASARLPLERTAERAAQARVFAGEFKERVAQRRAEPGPGSEDRVDQLAALTAEQAAAWIDNAAVTWLSTYVGQTASFTAPELAEAAETSVEAAQAFLDHFAVDFGDRADRADWQADMPRALGSEMETMRRRPILHDGKGRYLPSGVESIFFGLRDAFIDALKPQGKTWARFDRQRAKLLERRASAALEAALGADWAHGSVRYRFLDQDGASAAGEADGILRVDDLIVLVESKAGSLSDSARRAAPARLQRGLRDLLVEAYQQLDRAERALVGGAATEITDSSGRPLTLDLNDVTRVLRIAVTLEDLAPIASSIWQLEGTALFPEAPAVPWTVGIHELELICELTDRPAQLVHYVMRRLQSYQRQIAGMDELDFWMHYLEHDLVLPERAGPGQMLNNTDPLDAWAFGQQGLAPAADRPRQRLGRDFARLLDQVAAQPQPARLEAQLMLLDLDADGRRRVAGGLRRLARRTRRDGKAHEEEHRVDARRSVTLRSLPASTPTDERQTLAEDGRKRLGAEGSTHWLCLTSTGGHAAVSDLLIIASPVPGAVQAGPGAG